MPTCTIFEYILPFSGGLPYQLCCSVVGVDNDVDVADNIVDVTVCQLTIGSDGAVDEVKVDVKLEHTLPHCGSCVLRSGSVSHENCSISYETFQK